MWQKLLNKMYPSSTYLETVYSTGNIICEKYP
nr:MAG TPA: hypothetical protein [Caudoviricetes sp.]